MEKIKIIGVDDICTIYPMQGNPRKIKLNRMQYEIKSTNSNDIFVGNFQIKLPATKSQSFHLKISRMSNDYFYIESLLNTPIKINGKLIFKSYLHKYDEVSLGYNSLRFDKMYSKEQSEHEDKIFDHYDRIVGSDINILLQGETGTGKSRLASIIHDDSKKCGKFIHINLAAFSPSLIESQLFGHKKGTFTGAINDQIGALQSANHGTLFIDEIDSLPIDIQTKLLLFLDNQTFSPIGSSQIMKSKCRLIFASGIPLKDVVSAKKMRSDFYFRISSGVTWDLPSLKYSGSLIKKIINGFEKSYFVSFDHKLIDFYLQLDWPGNIRQLKGHLYRKKILSNSNLIKFNEVDRELLEWNEIEVNNLPQYVSIKELKSKYVFKVYNCFQGNVQRTSQALDISCNTVRTLVSDAKIYVGKVG